MPTIVALQRDDGPYWTTINQHHGPGDVDLEGAVNLAVLDHIAAPVVLADKWRVLGWDLELHDQFDIPPVWWKHGGNRHAVEPDVCTEPPFVWFNTAPMGVVVTEPCRMDEFNAGDLLVAFDHRTVQEVTFPMGDIGDRPIYAADPTILEVRDVAYPELSHDELVALWHESDRDANASANTGYGFYSFSPGTEFRRIFEFDFAT